jgi:hypothetical protein
MVVSTYNIEREAVDTTSTVIVIQEAIMYIVAIHTISNPEKFWTAAKNLSIPSHVKLHSVFPSTDGTKGVCLWQGESLAIVKPLVDSLTGGLSTNEYVPVEASNAMGLPR